ncbi:MAG: TetR/AcrR family transcriptional regulator [Myxococcales bacterium]|nr:TetR/AcrR family transcriptional regulator [Myxococcales bacterium]
MNPHSPKSDKRLRILESAEKVFAQKGFFGAKVADIAEDAGVADGTIYLYFRSKDELLISLFEVQMERVHEELERELAGASDPEDRLRRFMRAYVRLIQQNPHAAEVITIELRQSEKFMKQYSNPRFAEFLKRLAAIIDDGQQQGRFRKELPAPIVARALFGALDELALWWVSGRGEKLDLDKAAGWLGDLMLQGLVTKSDR